MPKRKADQHIEEWMKEGLVAVESSRVVAETDCNQVASQAVLTAEGASPGRGSDPQTDLESLVATSTDVAASPSEVAIPGVPPATIEVSAEGRGSIGQRATSEEDASDWFWNLLAQAGYEIW